MRFAIFNFLLALWVTWRFIAPAEIRRGIKAVLLVALVLAVAYPAAADLWLGGLLSPELPRWLIVGATGTQAVLFFLAGATLLREAIILGCVLAGRSGIKAHRLVQRDRRTVLGLLGASIGLGAFGMYEGIRVPDVVDRRIAVKDLPPELEGFSFVQLSDIHCSALSTEPHVRALVERVQSLSPDLILITGDFVDGTVKRRERDVAPLADLSAPMGVWGCEGNHEHYGNYDAWIAKIESLGIRLLKNAHTVLDVPGRNAKICLAGLADRMGARFGRETPDVKRALEGAPDIKTVPRILLVHQPKGFPSYRAEADFTLQLSGHTHGGQITGFDRGVAIMNGLFVRGEYALEDGTKLYVHPGSGVWNGFPFRVGVPAEIARITLVKA